MSSDALMQSQLPSAPRTPTRPSSSAAAIVASACVAPAAGIQSSPVKSLDVFTDHYKDIEASSIAEKLEIDPDFLHNHLLSPPPPDVNWEDNTQDQGLINTITGANNHSGNIYTPLTALLSRYSNRIHTSLPVAERPKHPLVFLDHHHHAPLAHPNKIQEKPDLVAVPGPITDYTQVAGGTHYSQVPYYKMFSIVECKPKRDHGGQQAARYCFQLMLARLDMPGVYGLWARPQGYQVIWSDASGAVASLETPWANLELLGAYVYSLYYQPPTHFLRDPYVHSPVLLPETASKGACWTIECPNHTYHYSDCETIIIGNPWNRRTHVWKHTDEQGIVVIKDSYRDDERRFKEEALLDKIHGETRIYPGVVRKLTGGSVPDITTAKRATETSMGTPERTKSRLVMGSFGEKLHKAESVRDILMVVYDVLEIHRGLFKSRRVLHRDISGYNILINPDHHPDTLQGKVLAEDRPKFIREVLDPALEGKDEDLSMALLIDFDNGADLDQVSEIAPQELASRTGTPMFIARSIARGQLLRSEHATDYVRMPELDDAAKEFYIGAYSEKTYEEFCDPPERFHGCKHPIDKNIFLRLNGKKQRAAIKEILQQKRETTRFLHRADHDVESIYWVLVIALLRAQPQEVSPVASLTNYYNLWRSFAQHTIERDQIVDSRDEVFNISIDDWETALDPKLSPLGDMLYAMGKQIRPEYALLESPNAEHLHEAMRRLLLEQIVEMESDPIPLQRGVLRPVPPPPPQPRSKRGTETLTSGSTSGSKKLKASLADNGLRPRRMIAQSRTTGG